MAHSPFEPQPPEVLSGESAEQSAFPPAPQSSNRDEEKTARKGVAIGCVVLLLIFALLAFAGVWAVKTLLHGGESVSLWPFSQEGAQEEPETPSGSSSQPESESSAVPAILETFYGDQFSDQRTLDLTVGEFLQSYNAAAPAKCQLDLNDSETLELIAGEESCDYDFFFYDEEAASYVFFGLSCLGDTPALDQPVESLFVSEDVVLSSPVLPQTLSAALSALPCGEKARQTLLDFLASAEGGETTLSAEFPGCQMYYSLSPRSDGKADLSAGIYPAYSD